MKISHQIALLNDFLWRMAPMYWEEASAEAVPPPRRLTLKNKNI